MTLPHVDLETDQNSTESERVAFMEKTTRTERKIVPSQTQLVSDSKIEDVWAAQQFILIGCPINHLSLSFEEDYQGPTSSGYFKWMPDENGQMRPVSRMKEKNMERNHDFWDRIYAEEKE